MERRTKIQPMNPKVDFFFIKATKWQDELNQLRSIALECGVNEELKWGNPCYTADGSNIVLIHAFKEYCALLFFKGALLGDKKKLLIQQTQNVQAARQMRFTSLKEVKSRAPVIRSYIFEAIEVEQAGLKVAMKKTSEFAMPEEFRKVLSKNAALNKAFMLLTPGRQRAYLLHFAAAKQASTREARIQKYTPAILEGKGLND